MQGLTAAESWAHYEKLLKDLLMVCQLPSIKHWPQLQEFLLLFAKQMPGAIARSAMHMAVSGTLMSTCSCFWVLLQGFVG